jgi:hypothetical protein
MAINIDFNAEQTERLVAAFEGAAYSYMFATGYMDHAIKNFSEDPEKEARIDEQVEVAKRLADALFPDGFLSGATVSDYMNTELRKS